MKQEATEGLLTRSFCQAAILQFAETMSLHKGDVELERMNDLGPDRLLEEMYSLVKRHAVPVAAFRKLPLAAAIMDRVGSINTMRTKKPQFKIDHLVQAGGFEGTFVQVNEDVPILTVEDSKLLVAMICKQVQQMSRM